MKQIALALLLFVAFQANAQEFKVYDNGLIYDERTMSRLGKIVDSLNIRFRNCDLSHPYYSLSQALATIVKIPNKNAEKDIKNKIPLDQYLKRYPQSTTQALITLTPTNFQGEQKLHMEKFGDDRESLFVDPAKKNALSNSWFSSQDHVSAWYIHDLKLTELPHDYARFVQYVDCMIDTSEVIFTGKKSDSYEDAGDIADNAKASLFIEFAEKFPGQPYFNYDSIDAINENDATNHIYIEYLEKFHVKHDRWNNARLAHLDEQVKTFPQLMDWLKGGAEQALTDNTTSDELEFYVARYLSKETALKLKRGRKVYGFCSQDRRPREHAANICMLSAETAQWDIFLRSHLDIMNDRFERATDGSYAWAGRQTYLHELEELDINAVDLLIGSCLVVNNVSNNHYYGSIARIGRALAETENKPAVEKQLLKMIEDPKLDPLNRARMLYLISHYAYNLDNEETGKQTFAKIEASVAKLPDYLRAGWKRWK